MDVASGILLLLQAQNAAKEDDGLKALGTALTAVLLAAFLLFSCVVYILTSPIEFLGAVGTFQLEYADRFGRGAVDVSNTFSEEEIERMTANLSDQETQEILQAGLSLVGKVPYFWGGKSSPGWNDSWGTLKVVTAPGVSSTGSLRPYGLDCSGFVAWVFETAGTTDTLQQGGTGLQWSLTVPIQEEALRPGDLAFKQPPSKKGINHVGIYYGETEDGDKLFLHCSAGDGGVVLNSYSGFRYFRRLEKE